MFVFLVFDAFVIVLLFRVDQLHSFFLRWTPERELDPLVDDDNQIPSREKDTTSQRGFLLVTDDSEASNEYEPTKDSEKTQEKPAHYIRRESKLLKEWEVRLKISRYSSFSR